jgi:hypothetical protein
MILLILTNNQRHLAGCFNKQIGAYFLGYTGRIIQVKGNVPFRPGENSFEDQNQCDGQSNPPILRARRVASLKKLLRPNDLINTDLWIDFGSWQ